jgi:RNA polymerase sporulation-specific sigma factor
MFSFLSSIFSYVAFLFGYISTTNLFPDALSKSEEAYLLKRYFSGDKNAKDKLIEHNLRLVAHIAKKYSSNTQDNEEFISIGTIGLIKGINSFSEEKGYKLSTYISKCIENEILMYLRSTKKTQGDISINNIIGTDKDGNDMELVDILNNDETDPIDNIYNKMITKQVLEYVNTKLPEREKNIICERYGLNGKTVKTESLLLSRVQDR